MEEKRMTESESLALITEMISRTKERYIGDGNIMLMWGYLTVIVTALVWIMLIFMATLSKENGLMWALICPILAYGFDFIDIRNHLNRTLNFNAI